MFPFGHLRTFPFMTKLVKGVFPQGNISPSITDSLHLHSWSFSKWKEAPPIQICLAILLCDSSSLGDEGKTKYHWQDWEEEGGLKSAVVNMLLFWSAKLFSATVKSSYQHDPMPVVEDILLLCLVQFPFSSPSGDLACSDKGQLFYILFVSLNKPVDFYPIPPCYVRTLWFLDSPKRIPC